MAAVSQIAISGWESLEADLKMAVADVILSNLPTSFILEMTASICGKIGKGNVVKYDFLKVCEGSFTLKDHEVVDLGSRLGSALATKRLKMDLKIEDHFECGFLRENEDFETKPEPKTGSKRDLKSGLKLHSKHDPAFDAKFDAKFDIIPGLSMDKIPGLLSEIYHNQTPSPTNTTPKSPSAVQKKINSKKVVLPDNNLPRSASSSFLSLNLKDLDNKLPSMFSDKPGSEEQFQLKRNAPMPDHFMQKSQTALRRMRILKCVKPSCPEQYSGGALKSCFRWGEQNFKSSKMAQEWDSQEMKSHRPAYSVILKTPAHLCCT